jgi:aldehyde oxidoreductase
MADQPDTTLGMDTQAPDSRASSYHAIQFKLNGLPRVSSSAPLDRLSDVLRDEFGMTGTKLGCSAGDCGLCTVSIGGAQACSCLVSLAQVQDQEVLTVEALFKDPLGKQLQQAFLDHGATQCGVCTPGMLMAAYDFLTRQARSTQSSRQPVVTEATVMDALSGVLCRCTGYRKIIEAVLSLCDVSQASPLKVERASAAAGWGHAGERQVRLDGPDKVRGLEKFAADVRPKDTLSLRVIRSPHSHARFALNDLVHWANGQVGLKGVLIAKDIPYNRFAIFPDMRDQPALAEAEVRFIGEAVAVLVGEESVLRSFADSDFPVRYQILPALLDVPSALAKGAAAVHSRWPDNVLCRGHVFKEQHAGALDEALQAGATPVGGTLVQGQMTTPYVEHAYLEPEAGYALWDEEALNASNEQARPVVTVFACTQTPYMDRDEIANMFKLAAHQVRIIPSSVGGGFGGKLDLSLQPLLVAAARKFGRPTRLVYGRRESMLSTTKRHPSTLSASISVDRRGDFLAFDFSGDFNTGAYSSWGPTVANRVPIHACGPYRFPNVRANTRAVLTHNAVSGAFRGFGVPQATLLTEGLIDELAHQRAQDPLEYRYRQALRVGDETATGQVLHASVGLQACLDALRPAWEVGKISVQMFNERAARTDLDQGSPKSVLESDPHRRYPGRKRRGMGIACMWYGIGNTGIANPSTISVGLRSDGRFMLYNGAVDIGQGTYTILPQICAQTLGVPVRLFDQIRADTWLTEDAGKSSASRQTLVSGAATKLAGESLRRKLLSLLGFAEDSPASLSLDLAYLKGTLGDEVRELDLGMMPTDARGDVALGSGTFNPPTLALDDRGQGVPYASYGFAAQCAEVEIDLDLGSVRVLHIHAAHDVGFAINPTQTEGQIHGGIAQGLGLALMEEYLPSKTDNLHDYLIPTVGDVPPITVHLIHDLEPLGPYGAKGVGEPALVATAPAILNAIRHATGLRMTQVPVTPSRLLAALKAKSV